MAVPNIRGFDPSPFTQASGQVLASGIQQIGAAGATVAVEHGKKRKHNKNVDQTLDTIAEHWDTLNPQTRQIERIAEGPMQQAEGPVQPGEGPKTKEGEFVRVHEAEANPDLFKVNEGVTKEPEPIANKKKYLEGIRTQIKDLSPEDLKKFQHGFGAYSQEVAKFKQKYGTNAIPWVEPTVQGFILDPQATNTKTLVKEFEQKHLPVYIRERINDYKELHADAFKAQAEGKMTPEQEQLVSSAAVMKWLGQTDGQEVTLFDDEGNQILNDTSRGVFEGKMMSYLSTADAVHKIDSEILTPSQIRSENLNRRTAESIESERRAKVIGIKLTRMSTSLRAQKSKLEAKNLKLKNNLDIGLSEKDREEAINTNDERLAAIPQHELVLSALEGLDPDEKDQFSTDITSIGDISKFSERVFDNELVAKKGSFLEHIRRIMPGVQSQASTAEQEPEIANQSSAAPQQPSAAPSQPSEVETTESGIFGKTTVGTDRGGTPTPEEESSRIAADKASLLAQTGDQALKSIDLSTTPVSELTLKDIENIPDEQNVKILDGGKLKTVTAGRLREVLK